MMDDRLAATFSELTKEDAPFRWQMRLLSNFINGCLPEAVDIPTGLGKTSIMALWLIARGEGAKLPRRLVYVVDRRAVVDQATCFAERLRQNMPADLASRLQLDARVGLPISTLRGGYADNRDWLENPTVPAIIVGTIDMIGSRMLFEGYGVSRGMRPYHAGLLGVDALVLLDEAHLCPPFEALLRQVAEHRDGTLGPKADAFPFTPPFRLMSLSATGRDATETRQSVFRLKGEDRKESVVHRRLTARKRLNIIEIQDAKSLAEYIGDRAVELGDNASPSRVLVYCHSRRVALDVKQRIDKEGKRRQRAGERAADYESELLVGERRVYERTKLEDWLAQRGFLGSSSTPPQAPTFLVATSAGEVGVDLDADHMVCDLVAYERMVQRLGRVNRRGGEGRSAMIEVFAVRPESKENARATGKKSDDLDAFEKRLAPLCLLPCGEDERCDASPSATVQLKSSYPDVVHAATTPAPLYPELSRPLVDAWSMTSLKQHEGRPEVAPWLRGWEDEEEPQTTVVWRKYLPHVRGHAGVSVSPTMVVQFFRSAPIHATEKLEGGSGRVFDWLLKRTAQLANHGENHDLHVEPQDIVAVLIDRAGEHVAFARFDELRRLAAPAKSMSKSERGQRDRRKREWREQRLPGAVLVVDARLGGLRDGMLDERSERQAVAADGDAAWREMKEDPSVEDSRPMIRFRLEEVSGGDEEDGLKRPTKLEDWRHVRTFEIGFDASGMVSRGLAVFKWHDDSEDEDFRSILSEPQLLSEHAEQVADRTWNFATELQLPVDEAEALATAARLHDDGKASARWQRAMNAPTDGIYAKTRGGGTGACSRAIATNSVRS